MDSFQADACPIFCRKYFILLQGLLLVSHSSWFPINLIEKLVIIFGLFFIFMNGIGSLILFIDPGLFTKGSPKPKEVDGLILSMVLYLYGWCHYNLGSESSFIFMIFIYQDCSVCLSHSFLQIGQTRQQVQGWCPQMSILLYALPIAKQASDSKGCNSVQGNVISEIIF